MILYSKGEKQSSRPGQIMSEHDLVDQVIEIVIVIMMTAAFTFKNF